MRVVMFDWNGTLLDDILIWYSAVKHIFACFDKHPPTIEEYFRELEGDYLSIYVSRGIMVPREKLNAIYEPYYQEHVQDARLLPGAKYVLRALRDQGIKLWLVTGQQESLVIPLLKKFRIQNYFRGCEFHTMNKVEIIHEILKKEGAHPRECALVGDAPSDMRHAQKAGIVSIAYLAGYIPQDLVINTCPTHRIRKLQDLLRLI